MIKWEMDENGQEYLKTTGEKFVMKENFKIVFGDATTYEELINKTEDEGWLNIFNDWKSKGILD